MVVDKVFLYCKENNISTATFEKKCNLSNGVIGKLRKSKGEPSLMTLKKIAVGTGIPLEKWLE